MSFEKAKPIHTEIMDASELFGRIIGSHRAGRDGQEAHRRQYSVGHHRAAVLFIRDLYFTVLSVVSLVVLKNVRAPCQNFRTFFYVVASDRTFLSFFRTSLEQSMRSHEDL